MMYSSRFLPARAACFFYILSGLFFFGAYTAWAQIPGPERLLFWGTDQGLYRLNNSRRTEILWSGGRVQKVIQMGVRRPSGNNRAAEPTGWAMVTDQGIFVSRDLKNWENRSNGLPEKVIKVYENGKKSFITAIQEIKDLKIDQDNPELMVCAFKDGVYLSRNGGKNWASLGMPSLKTNGLKAVGIIPPSASGGDLTVLCSHAIYGVHYINPDKAGAKWIELNTGLEKLETTDNPDEVSDFAVSRNSSGTEIYASQTFRRRVYRLNQEQKIWNLVWSDGSDFGTIDSLSPGNDTLRFVQDGEIMELKSVSGRTQVSTRGDLVNVIKAIPGNYRANCAALRENALKRDSEIINLSELWLLYEGGQARGAINQNALESDREGLYLPVNHARDPGSLRPYLDIIQARKLNMVVIDMKDDYGRLRFTPHNSEITNMGRVFRPVDLEAFFKTMKENKIYTVARVVVFKDPEAARKNGGKYAVWDRTTDKAWEGYYDTRRRKNPAAFDDDSPLVTAILPADDPNYEIVRSWYDEKWVDPYSEEIWDYNAQVAEELTRRGFDEIQFDYIRFPTDGLNLANARYRWQDPKMDMDSAIMSFLKHVRSRVSAPISVDIYGANGWYRTGARTGQEVELFAPYVDVICPMYYPSHFEQDFLAHDPAELRPYRIYSNGTQRTHIIARGRITVRPWAQAFYLNVSYDRKYYNTDYVRLQAEAVRAVGNGGLTYWNNSGRYEDIP